MGLRDPIMGIKYKKLVGGGVIKIVNNPVPAATVVEKAVYRQVRRKLPDERRRQYGVPLKFLVDKLAHVRFEPSGWTGDQ